MANHWTIAIGINQYQHLPPLRYARQDARALRNFLVNEMHLPTSHCWLFTDVTKTITEHESLALPDAILECLQQLATLVQVDDRVWFFFSGYGLCQNQTDYLVPIAGDPAQLATTAIPVRSLLEALATLPTQQVLLLLDISRRQEAIAQTTHLGAQTAALAGELGIATLLSCCPGQVSHEVTNLGHGLFTVALLEGLHQPPPLTLQMLDRYLRDRLPDLCRTHRQPLQNPSVIVPPSPVEAAVADRFTQVILERVGQPPLPPPANPDFPDWDVPPPLFDRSATPAGNPGTPSISASSPDLAASESLLLASSFGASVRDRALSPPLSDALSPPGETRWPPPVDRTDTLTAPSRLGTSLPSPLQDVVSLPPPVPPSAPMPMSPTPPVNAPVNPPDTPNTTGLSDRAFWGRAFLWGGAAVFLLILSILWRNWERLNMPSVPSPVASPTRPAASPNPITAPTLTPLPPITPKTDTEALRHTNQIVLKVAEEWTKQAPYQASSYSQAIAVASKIQPGEPLYEDAQMAMTAWSQEIMTIARERANWGDRQGAIAAAKLVPPSQTKVYPEAQAAIAQWQK